MHMSCISKGRSRAVGVGGDGRRRKWPGSDHFSRGPGGI